MCRESDLSNVQKEKFSSLLTDPSEKFEKYFPSFDAISVKFSLFTSPYSFDPFCTSADLEDTLAEELINLQCDSSFEDKQRRLPIDEFWVAVAESKQFPLLTMFAAGVLCMLGTTYVCEALFSEMKIVKSKIRTRLSDRHLTSILHIMNANKLEVDYTRLAKEKRCQTSSRPLDVT